LSLTGKKRGGTAEKSTVARPAKLRGLHPNWKGQIAGDQKKKKKRRREPGKKGPWRGKIRPPMESRSTDREKENQGPRSPGPGREKKKKTPAARGGPNAKTEEPQKSISQSTAKQLSGKSAVNKRTLNKGTAWCCNTGKKKR